MLLFPSLFFFLCAAESIKSQQVYSAVTTWLTSFLDSVTGPYLAGQWCCDPNVLHPSCMNDKATQVKSHFFSISQQAELF